MDDHVTAAERQAAGKEARSGVPRSAHAEWSPPEGRPDPVDVLSAQDDQRLPWLVPVRHARMAESPFAFYRGAAAVMAADLAPTPTIGVSVQLCGDAHLANFGTYASPERRQVFDLNDFDETLPGPWEWDVKRLAASVVLACRNNGYPKKGEMAAEQTVAAYRRGMRTFAALPPLDVWYAQVSLESLRQAQPTARDRKAFDKRARKARERTSEKALGKLTDVVDGHLAIRSQPPLLDPWRDLAAHLDPAEVAQMVEASFRAYADTLTSDRQVLLRRFRLVDGALKVVGVGSVGTRCHLVLLQDRDQGAPLFLQIKQATRSVLEDHLPPSGHPHHGERVVAGQQLMQASHDIFLGWSGAIDGTQYYWRQFHDMKGSADVAAMNPDQLERYGELCGWTLAHAHARAGDSLAISSYLGKGSAFDEAVAAFAVTYADQTEADHAAFTQAIADGRITATTP